MKVSSLTVRRQTGQMTGILLLNYFLRRAMNEAPCSVYAIYVINSLIIIMLKMDVGLSFYFSRFAVTVANTPCTIHIRRSERKSTNQRLNNYTAHLIPSASSPKWELCRSLILLLPP